MAKVYGLVIFNFPTLKFSYTISTHKYARVTNGGPGLEGPDRISQEQYFEFKHNILTFRNLSG